MHELALKVAEKEEQQIVLEKDLSREIFVEVLLSTPRERTIRVYGIYEDKTVGFVSLVSRKFKENIAKVCGLYVEPDFRNRSFGTIILRKAFDYCQEEGVNKVEVVIHSQRGMSLYNNLSLNKEYEFELIKSKAISKMHDDYAEYEEDKDEPDTYW